MIGTSANAGIPALSRARRRLRQLGVLLVVGVVTLSVEHWRGQKALRSWKARMTAQGEFIDAGKLWPRASASNRAFSNELAQATHALPEALHKYAGMLSGVVQDETGQTRRGSQEPRPPLGGQTRGVSDWEDLGAAVRQAQPALRTFHRLMKDPPAGMGCDIVEELEKASFPNYGSVRCGAQALEAATISDLHQGDLAGALDDLEALLGFRRLYAQDPGLVNFMIRVAITGLSVPVCWDALQDPGWTEPQLARLQMACQAATLLPQMPRTLEAERAVRVHQLSWFRAHSYEQWLARYQPIYSGFGTKLPAWDAAPPVRFWRQWVFHPLWAFAWADQEELIYLEHSQSYLTAVRQAGAHQSWAGLEQRLTADQQAYRPPPAAWRFYLELPLVDRFCDTVGSSRITAKPVYPYPDFSRAWRLSFKNLTLHEMVIAALAIKRHELRRGKRPADLESLVPAFLAAVPRDFMDGQPLRYRLNADGSFTLYSVGEDGRDDGGDPLLETAAEGAPPLAFGSGRDLVWPQVSPSAKR